MSLLMNAISPRCLVIVLLALASMTPQAFAANTPGEPFAAGHRATPVVTIVTADQVYYPTRVKKGKKYTKPAVLTTSTIFDSISEWKEIKKKKLTEKDAEYHLLLKKANEKFDCALKTAQKSGGYDIIAEVGAITCKNCTATDITSTVIASLP